MGESPYRCFLCCLQIQSGQVQLRLYWSQAKFSLTSSFTPWKPIEREWPADCHILLGQFILTIVTKIFSISLLVMLCRLIHESFDRTDPVLLVRQIMNVSETRSKHDWTDPTHLSLDQEPEGTLGLDGFQTKWKPRLSNRAGSQWQGLPGQSG